MPINRPLALAAIALLLSACSSNSGGGKGNSLEQTLATVAANQSNTDRSVLSALIPECIKVMRGGTASATVLATKGMFPKRLLLGENVFRDKVDGSSLNYNLQMVPVSGKSCEIHIKMTLRQRLALFKSNSGSILEANGFTRTERQVGLFGNTQPVHVSQDGTIIASTQYVQQFRSAVLTFERK